MAEVIELDPVEAGQIVSALRMPRGRYSAERASQLSGIPRSTLYWWARRGALVPDFARSEPKNWSYRDLVLGRLMGWLRVLGMPLDESAARVALVRKRLAGLTDGGATVLRSDGRSLLLQESDQDELSGQAVFEGLTSFLPSFELLEPLKASVGLGRSPYPAEASGLRDHLPEELPKGRTRDWGPNLVRPSERTRISPWVMAGEPCIANTRIPTASVWALAKERQLRPGEIASLYPGVDVAGIEQALELEHSLRAA
jgi:uncharacterized protein (DUF433 family)/DNA-binding transcriptional MerR regulator